MRPLRPCSGGRELFQEQAAPRIPRGAEPRGPNPNAVSAVPVAPPDPTPRRPHMPVLPAPGTREMTGVVCVIGCRGWDHDLSMK